MARKVVKWKPDGRSNPDQVLEVLRIMRVVKWKQVIQDRTKTKTEKD